MDPRREQEKQERVASGNDCHQPCPGGGGGGEGAVRVPGVDVGDVMGAVAVSAVGTEPPEGRTVCET